MNTDDSTFPEPGKPPLLTRADWLMAFTVATGMAIFFLVLRFGAGKHIELGGFSGAVLWTLMPPTVLLCSSALKRRRRR